MKVKRFSETDKANAVDLYVKGVDLNLIYSAIGCSPSTLQNWVDKAGVPKRMDWRQINAIQAQSKTFHGSMKVNA